MWNYFSINCCFKKPPKDYDKLTGLIKLDIWQFLPYWVVYTKKNHGNFFLAADPNVFEGSYKIKILSAILICFSVFFVFVYHYSLRLITYMIT